MQQVRGTTERSVQKRGQREGKSGVYKGHVGRHELTSRQVRPSYTHRTARMRMRQLETAWCRFYVLSLCTCLLVSAIHPSQGVPIGNPEHALESMRQIPQWHCLRYRRFDLVKRCRNYRVAQATNHHELPEPHHVRRLQLASLGSPEKTLQSTEK